MGLETASFISQLNPNNPVGGVDNYSTADDHFRLVKSVLQTTFPTASAALTATMANLNTVTGAVELTSRKDVASGYAGIDASGFLADARVKQSNVTQHQAALALAGSQITTGTVADARLSSNVPFKGSSNNFTGGNQAFSGATELLRLISDSAFMSFYNAAGSTRTGYFQMIAGGLVILANETVGQNVDLRTASGGVVLANGSLIWTAANDGPGTGLDADFLDGAQGSFYQNASNLNAGTLADARVVASNVTQHQASLVLAASQITSGAFNAARVTGVDANCTINGVFVGYRTVPRRTSGLADNECLATSGGVTVNTSDCAAGSCKSIYNDSASAITITQGAGVTMRLSGTATTGSRTLAQRGYCTIWGNSGSECVIMGSGLT